MVSLAKKNKGPTVGHRILVELPFGKGISLEKGSSRKKSKLIKVKENVAAFLGFKAVTTLKTQSVTFNTAKGKVTATRLVSQGSYRRKSVTLLLDKPRVIGKSPGTYKSIDLPLGSGCTVTDAVIYFQQNGPAKGIIGIKTPDGVTRRFGTSSSTN